MKLCGLDLAGKTSNKTGICFFIPPQGGHLGRSETKIVYSDEEIINEIDNQRPDCIGIDAPLWFSSGSAWRRCDELLMMRGFQPLSISLPSMRLLALRASTLVKKLRQKGYKIIEVFPRGAEKILGLSKEARKNKDEYDALLCALTAKAFMEDNFEDLGGIILPK